MGSYWRVESDNKKLFIGRGVLDSAAKVAAYVVSKYDAVPD